MRNPEKTKGRTVGVWLSGADIEALDQKLKETPYLREGTYGADAIRERLRSEGYLKDGSVGRIAARALEVAKVVGVDVFERELERIAEGHVSVLAEGRG